MKATWSTCAETFKAAIVQDSPVLLDLQASVDKACELIVRAADDGARLVVFPETWLPGYPFWLDVAPGAALWDHDPAKKLFAAMFDNALTIPGPELDQLKKTAGTAGATVVLGVNELDGGTIYNTIIYLGADGELLGRHRKLMPTYSERMVWGQGGKHLLTVVDSPVGRVGGLVCWEHWMPLARQAMHDQQELVHAALWPTVKEMNLVASRQYAFEGQCYVLAAGSVLRRDETAHCSGMELIGNIPSEVKWFLRGGSAIIAPDGTIIAGPVFDKPAILTAEIHPRHAVEGRLALDVSGHYSRPDVLKFRVDRNSEY